MAPRAVWKGYLKVAELTCPVALYTAISTSERIAFHTLNRATNHRVHRQFVDSETGDVVERDDQVKGYDLGQGDFIVLEPEELAAAVPDNDKSLAVKSFVACKQIDDVFLDRPYYLMPSDKVSEKAYGLIRDGLEASKVAALAQAVLFRRLRTLLIRAHDGGLVATMLNFVDEVRPAAEAFETVPDLKIKNDMLDLAEHIIRSKAGTFDPAVFDDRYENAVADMVRAKIDGRPLVVKKAPHQDKVVDLMAALRASAGVSQEAGAQPKRRSAGKSKSAAKAKVDIEAPKPASGARVAAPRRKAG